MTDSVFTTGSNYYPQVFLQECMLLKKKRCLDLLLMTEISSDFDENSNEKNFNEEN